MTKYQQASTFESPITNIPLEPLRSQRAPTSSDIGYPVGQFWVDVPNAEVYILSRILAGVATWSQVAVGAFSTLTADDYTAPAAQPLLLTAPSGEDVEVVMGDDAGANKVSFQDDGAVEVASIDSDGAAIFNGNVTLNGAATQLVMQGGAATDFVGQATLVAGVATVLNTNIAAGDRIFLTRADPSTSTALGDLSVTAQTPATSFEISALNPTDATVQTNDVSVVNYFIVRQI